MSQRRSAKTSLPPPPPEAGPLHCPRCDSNNTKFCYYNNYNLSQPRHFCKSCRRYWTRGGTLRDVPVGGGSRKNSAKRSRTTTATATAGTPPPFHQLNGEQYHQHHPHVFGGGGSAFTSLLSGGGGGTIDHGLFGLEDLGFGLKGRGNTLSWPFGADTWHVGSVNSDCGFAADYLPELSIASTPGDFMK